MKSMNKNFDSKHDNPQDCQLILALTGSSEFIQEQLQSMLIEYSNHSKPRQRIYIQYEGTREVITPIWNTIKY